MTIRKVAGRLLAALGLAGAASGAANAAVPQEPPVAPAEAPAAWIAFAETVTRSVSAWLEDDSAASEAVRTYLGAAEAGETHPLELRLWISADGRVSRIDFAPFAYAEANQAMIDALVGRTLQTSPPADMRQPLRIAVQPGSD